MGFSAHRGTTGHTIGKAIIGHDDGHPLPGEGQSAAPTPEDILHIHAHGSPSTGYSIHSHVGPQGSDPRNEQLHQVRDAQEAHSHMGALLGVTGVRVGSGERKD